MSHIDADKISKVYRRYPSKWAHLLEALSSGRLRRHEEFWALRDVSFHVPAGGSLGIIGANGSGKSTLLRILAGTTQPTTGNFALPGRTAALLELGMGFHSDFTGTQNAIMGCQLLGLSGNIIDDLLPEIVAFSELADYIDQPIRSYSSGMQMRLAFSVATAVRPDILIVDEALSVGDTYFQHKSIQRIREFRNSGTTLLFVSHDPAAVKTLCDQAILLDQGLMTRSGTPEEVLDYYNAMVAHKEAEEQIQQSRSTEGSVSTRSGDGRAKIESVEIVDAQGRAVPAFRVGDAAQIRCRVRFQERVKSPTVGILLRDRLGNDVFGTNTFHLKSSPPVVEAGAVGESHFDLTLNLGPGNYSLTVAVHDDDVHVKGNYDWWDNACVFQMIPAAGPEFIGCAHLPVSAEWNALDPAQLDALEA